MSGALMPTPSAQASIQCLVTASQPAASQAQRREAVALADQLKSSEPHASVDVAVQLVQLSNPVEVQHFGYTLLQHLVGQRWDEFSTEEQAQLASISLSLLQQVAAAAPPFVIRSKAAVLMSLVAKRRGADTWQVLLPELLKTAGSGPAATEMVCLVLNFVTEDITFFADDLDAESKRQLLAALLGSLAVTLPFLQHSLEGHFTQAAAAAQQGNQEGARAHSAVVSAALGACLAHAEWAPVGRMHKAGLLEAWAYLLTTPEFRMTACDVLRQLASRIQSKEDLVTFKRVMDATGDALMRAASAVLAGSSAELGYEGALDDFGQRLCDSMAIFGAAHFHCLSTQEKKTLFLQQSLSKGTAIVGATNLHCLIMHKKKMLLCSRWAVGWLVDIYMLAFTQNSYLLLSSKALPLWVALLTASIPSPNGKEGGKDKRAPDPAHSVIPLDCVSALMDLAGTQVHGARVPDEDEEIPPFFDTYLDYKDFCVGYRSELSQVVRLTSTLLPEAALQAAQHRLKTVLQICGAVAGPQPQDNQQLFKAATFFLESVVSAVSKSHIGCRPASPSEPIVLSLVEQLLQLLLAARLADPDILEEHAKALEGFGHFLIKRSDLVPLVIQKVFEMYSYQSLDGNAHGAPPAKPSPAWKKIFNARQKVSGVLVGLAKTCPRALAPHLAAMATQVQEMWQQGLLWAGERNVLCDGLVITAGTDNPSVQSQVVGWVLSSVKTDWESSEWQQRWVSPAAFASTFLDLTQDAQGQAEVRGQEGRWLLYHHLHLLERCAKRMPRSQPLAPANPQGAPTLEPVMIPGAPGWHALNGHIAWFLPQLLLICGCMQSLWGPECQQLLAQKCPPAFNTIRAAFDLGPKERAVYLRQPVPKGERGQQQTGEEEGGTLAGTNAAAVRTWIRQVQESIYQTLGALSTQVSGLYCCEPGRQLWAPALLRSLEHVHPQYQRMMLRHLMLPFTKHCPPQHRDGWLLPVLQPLMPHMLQRLTAAWSTVLSNQALRPAYQEGDPNVSATAEDSEAANDDVVMERLLRELTREHLTLLVQLQEQRPASGSGKGKAATPHSSDSAFTWLFRASTDTALTVIATAAAALWWPDSDVCSKSTAICRAVLPLAGQDPRLQTFIGTDMLRGSLAALSTTRSTAGSHQGDVLGLIRDILVQQLATQPGPRQELLRLPRVTPQLVDDLQRGLQATASDKEQRNTVKKLMSRAGYEQLRKAVEGGYKPIASAAIQLAEPRLRALKYQSVDQQGGDMSLGNIMGPGA